MRAITSTTRTSTTRTSPILRTACVAVTAVLGLSVLAVAEQQLTAPAPSTVAADGPVVTEAQEEWNSRG
ncbi:hypothetical protein [Streptomyces aureus]|uniref:hypothetical protein n=1 Tax=Streptomyces aureus TaxID=193461 RepID=UPI0006E31DA3|nr:hypothetical protein [Streptomyces aureus]